MRELTFELNYAVLALKCQTHDSTTRLDSPLVVWLRTVQGVYLKLDILASVQSHIMVIHGCKRLQRAAMHKVVLALRE
jgi:hypothetical protein